MQHGSSRARILKLADRISNMTALGFVHDAAFVRRYLEETRACVLPTPRRSARTCTESCPTWSRIANGCCGCWVRPPSSSRRAFFVHARAKSMCPRSTSVSDQLDLDPVADVEALLAAHHPALHRRRNTRTHVPLGTRR